VLFGIYKSREAVVNEFGSVISPKELKIRNSIVLANRFSEFKEILNPRWMSKNEYIRIGSKYDGGYVIPKNLLKKVDFLISGGIENNNDFEIAVAEFGIKGLQIDNSIEKPPINHANLSFKKITLGVTENNINFFMPKSSKNIMLKLDIEGAEYETLRQIKSFKNLICIIIEFHNLNRIVEEKFWQEFKFLLAKIKRSHDVVYRAANNCGGVSIIGNNLLPKVTEVTFARKDSIKNIKRVSLANLNFGKNCAEFPELIIK
jgi:hypothetical protein